MSKLVVVIQKCQILAQRMVTGVVARGTATRLPRSVNYF